VCVKSGLKQEKSSVRPFKTTLKFFTRVEGGIGGPNPPYVVLGSPVKTSRNLFRKIKLQSSCMFLRLLLRGLYGPSYVSSFKSGVKNSTIQ
jgi:hypothetical protein